MQHLSFSHAGDLGDIVASLAVIKQMGGGSLFITDRGDGRRESMKGARFEAIRPLLEAQPYLNLVGWMDDPHTDHDFSDFRHDHVPNEDLATWQGRHVGVKTCLDPWLLAYRSPKSIGRVIVARSFRYQNQDFPWKRLVAQYRKQILFVGLPDEHRHFQIAAGAIVEYQPTRDLLEMAELIAGCDLFIGNQSCPFWIAAGLGVKLIQETYLQVQNSTIKRPNTKYFTRQPFDL